MQSFQLHPVALRCAHAFSVTSMRSCRDFSKDEKSVYVRKHCITMIVYSFESIRDGCPQVIPYPRRKPTASFSPRSASLSLACEAAAWASCEKRENTRLKQDAKRQTNRILKAFKITPVGVFRYLAIISSRVLIRGFSLLLEPSNNFCLSDVLSADQQGNY